MIVYALCLTFGYIAGITYTMWTTERAIKKSDLCHEDRRMIRDVLGIAPNGERE